MRYVLDTSALLAHFRGESGAQGVQSIFEDEAAEIFICAITVAELSRRLHDLGVPAAELSASLSAYEAACNAVLAVDAETARVAYRLIRATPARLPMVDALIAAAASQAGATLVHRDAHLSAIPASELSQQTLLSSP